MTEPAKSLTVSLAEDEKGRGAVELQVSDARYLLDRDQVDYLIHKLLTDVEGTCTGRFYIICVLDTYNISMGKIIPGSTSTISGAARAIVRTPVSKAESSSRSKR